MIEIGTRAAIQTIAGTFTGTVYSYDEATKMYTLLLDDDGVTPPEQRLIGSTTITPVTETQS